MIFNRRVTRFFVLAWLVFLSGCAGKLPQSIAVNDSEKQQILSRFKDFQSRVCDETIDADVSLVLTTLGKSEKASGILQVQAPSFIRYTATDPLGRSLLLLVTDGDTFTLANNRKGEGYKGFTDSPYFNKYIPTSILPEDIFSWLSGSLGQNRLLFEDMGRDKANLQQVWLKAEGDGNNSHHVLFDVEAGHIVRHLVANDRNTILIDFRYENYSQDTSRCPWPMKLTIESEKLTGTVTLYYGQIFFNAPLKPELFYLQLPPHFKINSVD